jgi:hypothetical protein
MDTIPSQVGEVNNGNRTKRRRSPSRLRRLEFRRAMLLASIHGVEPDAITFGAGAYAARRHREAWAVMGTEAQPLPRPRPRRTPADPRVLAPRRMLHPLGRAQRRTGHAVRRVRRGAARAGPAEDGSSSDPPARGAALTPPNTQHRSIIRDPLMQDSHGGAA